MLVSTREMLKRAKEENYAIPAPNFFDFRSATDYIEVAEKNNKPLILAFAEGHITQFSLADAASIGRYLAKKATVPVALHLDHGMDERIIKNAIDLGFTSVMIDASKESFENNVYKTKRIVEYARPREVSVEAEIGHVGAGDDQEQPELTKSIYTEPEQALKFVMETDVDSLAVSIGTAHGFYKETPKINFDCLQEITKKLSLPLVLHGGSSSGDTNLNLCATKGMSKINLFTDLVDAGMEQIQENQDNSLFELEASRSQGMKKMLEHYYQVFATKDWREV